MQMINLARLPTLQEQPLDFHDNYLLMQSYLNNMGNTMMQDLNIIPRMPEGADQYEYTNKYGDKSYYLYGGNSDDKDRLTQAEVNQLIEAKKKHQAIFNQAIKNELMQVVAKRESDKIK